MSDRAKTLLKVLGFLALCGVLAYGMIRIFFGGAPSVTTPTNTDPEKLVGGLVGSGAAGDRPATNGGAGSEDDTSDALPTADTVANGGATITRLLTNTDVIAPTLTADGTLAYYDPADGRFYTINDNGEVEQLAQARFPDAETVVFANNATSAVIEFPDGSNVIYGFDTGKQVTLPTHWEDFAFTSAGTSVVSKSIGNDSSNRALVMSSTDGTRTKVIAALGDNDDKVNVSVSPTGNTVAFSRTGSSLGFGRSEYYLIDQQGEASGNLIVEGTNFSAIWAPDGSHILYSVANSSASYRPSLWYVDSAGDRHGDTRVNLGVETWVEKCVFASASSLYCAVPQEMVDGAGSTHSMVTSPDSVYRIDLPSGRTTLLGYAAAESKMENLTLSSDGDTLYFQDEYGRINAMQLR